MKDFLAESMRQELKAHHSTERDCRIADRIKAILLANKGWTYRQIGEALMLDEETVSRHIKEYLCTQAYPHNGKSYTHELYPINLKVIAGDVEEGKGDYGIDLMPRAWRRDNDSSPSAKIHFRRKFAQIFSYFMCDIFAFRKSLILKSVQCLTVFFGLEFLQKLTILVFRRNVLGP